jgi:hypothetical protein
MRKFLLAIPVFLAMSAFSLSSVEAHCPVCTIAVGAAAVTAKYYGLDVSIIGLLMGAFGISTGLWLGRRVKRQYIRFQLPLIILTSFLLTVVPLLFISGDFLYLPVFLFGPLGSIFNNVYLIDKMLLGSIIGGFVTLGSYRIHNYVKNKNGRVLFPFQGVVFTLGMLAMSGLLLSFIGV